MKKTNIRALSECSVMVAFATVLSLLKLTDLPYGGSITLASMFPIVVVSYRHGLKWGIGASLTASLLQMLLGLNNFSYFTTWYSIAALALFDYILAFGAYGIAGIFRKFIKHQNLALVYGAFCAAVLRYICHVISGATVWAGLSIPDSAALIYSIAYNATYMIPDTIILSLVAGYLGAVIDFRRSIPLRIKISVGKRVDTALGLSAGIVLVGALIFDTVAIFSRIQDEDGNFAIDGLKSVNWAAVAIVSAVCVVVSAALISAVAIKNKKKNQA